MPLFQVGFGKIGFDQPTLDVLNRLVDTFDGGSNQQFDELKSLILNLEETFMANAAELKTSVDNLTKEVSENNALLDTLQQTNTEQAGKITALTEQVNALNISNAEKDALLAGLDEIKQGIDANAAALDARQTHEDPPPPPVEEPEEVVEG